MDADWLKISSWGKAYFIRKEEYPMKNYAVTLSLPGGGRKVLFALDIGEAVTGTMTNPYAPQELLPVAGTAAD